MIIGRNVLDAMVESILRDGAIQAIKYFSPKLRAKTTRRLYNGKIDKRNKSVNIILTIGPPNFSERKFVKQASKAGEPFPIKKIQLKFIKIGGK